MMITLRLVSLMAPNHDSFYRALARWLTQADGICVEVEDRVPWQARERMLDGTEAHLGFICGLPYVWKADSADPPVELLAAPIMLAPRYGNRPIYFSDVVVRADSRFQNFDDLRGAVWAYNEPNSHSGHIVVRYELARRVGRAAHFRNVIESGHHETSLRMVLDGHVDASAIDSIVLETELARHPELSEQIRVIDSFGPSPAPPAVASTKLPSSVRRHLRDLLLTMHRDLGGQALLHGAGIARFADIQDADYDPIRHMARVAKGVRWPRRPARS